MKRSTKNFCLVDLLRHSPVKIIRSFDDSCCNLNQGLAEAFVIFSGSIIFHPSLPLAKKNGKRLKFCTGHYYRVNFYILIFYSSCRIILFQKIHQKGSANTTSFCTTKILLLVKVSPAWLLPSSMRIAIPSNAPMSWMRR